MTGSSRYRVIALLLIAALTAGCIFDSEPAEPGFPSKPDAVVSFQDIGDPIICKCMSGSGIALVAAGSSLAVLDLQSGASPSVLEMGIEIDDVADTDAAGMAWVLAGSILQSVDYSAPSLGTSVDLGSPGSYAAVSGTAGLAMVAMANDSLLSVDLSTGEASAVDGLMLRGCQGLAFGGADRLLAALAVDGAIVAYDTGDWSEVGRVSVPGDVIDLFPGPSGYVCAIVNGSNELWFIRTSDCKLYKMVTFPETPVSAASMPQGDFAFAACPSTGVMVVAENGQVEFRSADLGLPVSIDITPDGERAVLCSPDEGKVYILVK